jgi:catechol 2,3-dioxygenase
LWGHPAPKSWFEEGSHFVGATLREPALAAQPIVAR